MLTFFFSFFFCSEKDATPHCVTAVPLCTFPSKAAIQHAPCLLPSYKNSFERNAFAWIESSLTWEVELADPVASTAKEDDPGNCRCPCVSGRPLNQVIWLTVFAAICFGLLWWGQRRVRQKNGGVGPPLVVFHITAAGSRSACLPVIYEEEKLT